MKLTSILILAATLHVAAAGKAQQVSLSLNNESLEKAFKEVEKQTGYQFFYKDQWLENAKKISVHVKNVSLQQALDLCFKDQPFSYEIVDKTIVLKLKEKSPNDIEGHSGLDPESFPPIDITGKVTDENGNPLIGASVKVKNTNRGTTTNNDGVFTLKGVDDDAVLEISYVGFEGISIPVNNKTSIATSLKPKPENLGEVIINKGYYTEKMRNTVGNVTHIDSKTIEQQPVQNPLLALQGRVPGLEVTQLTGINGGGVKVRIQGQNSIQSGLDPLIVVDGVPFPSKLYTSLLEGIVQTGSPLNYINRDDIESIDILKDADATAIYGSRAANGAIIITTKKGKAGKTRININLQQGWGKVGNKVEMLNTRQYLDMRHEALKNDGRAPNPSRDYDLTLWDTTRYTDWQKELIGGTAKYTNIYTSISGGSSSMQYLIGGTYNRQTTVFPGSFDDEKGGLHFNVSGTTSSQKLKMQLSGNYMYDQNHLPSVDLTRQALLMEPDAPALYNADGSLNWAPTTSGRSSWINPLSYIMSTDFNNTTTNLVSNLNISYSILPGLELRSIFGYSNIQTDLFLATRLESYAPEKRATEPRYTNNGTRNMNSWIIEPQASYAKRLGKGKFEALVGGSILQNSSRILTVGGIGYPTDLLMKTLNAAQLVVADLSTASKSKFNALFGRINYIWNDKYVINLTARRDGSSKFGDANKLHNFGSAGLGWIFSHENWIQDHLNFLSFGKLKFSYGTTGNDQIGDFGHLSLYSLYNGTINYQNGIGLEPQNIPNPHLQWEETRKLQTGLDFGLISDRILFGAAYSVNRSSNQLIAYVIPSTTGFTSITENLPAVIQNTSLEVILNTTNLRNKKFLWTTNVNLTFPRNKLVSFPGIEKTAYASGKNGVIVGEPLGVIKAYGYGGVDPATGKYQILDRLGKPTVNYGLGIQSYLNSNFVNYYGGFQNTLQYKKIAIDLLFQFIRQKGPKDMFYYNGSVAPGRFVGTASNQPVTVLSRWQKAGDNSEVGRYTTGSSLPVVPPFTVDYLTYDASYIRLKNLSLSWQLPTIWMQKTHLQNARLYFTGQNLLTITKYSGLDPENRSISSLPPLRVMTVGVQIEL
jgi:TonB-linked SusC/RagA family outer membrane protein